MAGATIRYPILTVLKTTDGRSGIRLGLDPPRAFIRNKVIKRRPEKKVSRASVLDLLAVTP